MRSSNSVRSLAILLVLGIGGCASSTTVASDRGIAEPQVRVRLPVGQVVVPSGSVVDMNLQVDIYNPAEETIVLRRLQVSSLPTADIQFAPTRRNLSSEIAPQGVITVDMWVRAQNTGAQTDPRFPLEVRGTAVFDSPNGKFRKVFIGRVVESQGDQPDAQ